MAERDSSDEARVSEPQALLDAAIAFLLFSLPPFVVGRFLGPPAQQSTEGLDLAARRAAEDLNLAAKVENGSLVLLPGMMLMVAYALWRRGALPFRPRPIYTVVSYLVFAVAWIPAAMMLYPYLVHLAGYDFEAQQPVLYYARDEYDNSIWLVLVVSCVLAPIAEEVFFRGFLFRAVENATSPVVALLVTSVLFAAVHTPSVMIPVGFLGLFFGYLRLKTGGVGASILAHFVHNAWTVGFLLLRPEWIDLVYDR